MQNNKPNKNVKELTVIIPAYNEAASIVDTIRSLQEQTIPTVLKMSPEQFKLRKQKY
jgi:glycosyltransferase involved in cell wall biosynthesis